ncbi:DMT family transporter [Salipiger abyssi]|uniref:EamA-like transporter family protein n=1 Tax=Salipiger abyssi TaxID=1250539 RepID=A0A1P8UZH3_9RHOB|nr:DMT family transporter [Salipiger abyssi]APZ54792.1 EamA-like transporter family protein [Salipiger abyssi]
MDTLRAILLMVLAMALLACSDAFLKLASQHAPVGQVMAMLSLGGTALFIVFARLRRVKLRLAEVFERIVILRNAFEIIGAAGMIVGLSKIPLSLMAAIMQTAPLVVTVGAAIFLQEPVGWRRWTAIGVGLAGMLMVIRPFGAEFTGWEIFPVIGVTGLAARDLVTRMVPQRIHSLAVSTYGFAAIFPVGLALMLISPAPFAASPPVFLYMAGAIAVTTAGYLSVTTAMRMATVSAVAPFRYTRLIFTTGLGMAIFAERPDGWTLAGSALILGAGLYSYLRERRLSRAAMI